MDFAVLKQKPCTVYLIVPPRRLQTYAKWLRWMIASILQALMQDVRRAKVPVLILIDEAYPILRGGFPILEQNYAQLREFGVKIAMMFQSLAQPIELFGEKGFETYVGNAGVFQNFAPQDMVTAEYLSKMSGETTGWHASDTDQQGFGGGGASMSKSGGMSEFARPLFLPHELRQMDDGWTVAWSHMWKGTALSYLPYPDQLRWMRDIVALDPAA
jgi:type IV secretion system protein VirD4